MDCKIAVAWMHEYLDGDLVRRDAEILREHIRSCQACRAHWNELASTEAFARGLPAVEAPADLEKRILDSLPKPRRRPVKWVSRHPAVSAAALFVIIMLSSFITTWNQDRQMSVSVSEADMEVLEFDGTTVIVPEGKVVSGDLTIVNGSAEVLGEVKGNLTVIDGKVMLASTAHIAGNVKQIDRAVDWAWYKIRSWFGTLAYGM